MKTSWQSATPGKPIAAPRRPNQNSALPAPHSHWERQPWNGSFALPLP
jgi:hypothetical protein